MSGQVGDLSPVQEKVLTQFRENIRDVLPALPNTDDAFLLRWLRARGFDLDKAEDMLRKHVVFRKQQDLDNILEWQPPQVLRLYTSSSLCGHDLEGSPVWLHLIRGLDLKGLLLSVTKQQLLRDKFRNCELLLRECEQQSQKLGKKVERVTTVFDLEGLGLRHLWKPGVEFAQEFFSALEANYPEILKHIIVVRAPRLFPVAFNLIKPYMREETRQKVVILGDNWKQELHRFISPDQLPMEFGGTMTDPDGNPKCLTKINYGGEVPQSYHRRNQERLQYEHSVSVGRGSSQQVENEILFPGCVLRWQFASDGGDIGFGIFLKTKIGERQRAGEMTEVLASQRYNAHLVPEDGSLTCSEAGVYVLRFDNTFSLLHSKHISYTVEVLLPDHNLMEKMRRS
ncbi:putative SEC14-like protein 6 [Ochotona curzoniae]|uniref:putative SEC14-like protein 6 n=1 Tax=Ochotona curzoniae TaxID=130825 RepID=UPI001B34705A|nr:putative SEC14-like protein 6 [Ochotona curzoniae]